MRSLDFPFWTQNRPRKAHKNEAASAKNCMWLGEIRKNRKKMGLFDFTETESSKHTAKLTLNLHEKEQNLLIKEIALVGLLTTMKTTSHAAERLSENFRCDTPQQRVPVSSPTSPHSSASNRYASKNHFFSKRPWASFSFFSFFSSFCFFFDNF